MKSKLLLCSFLLLGFGVFAQSKFLSGQMASSRVRTAQKLKGNAISQMLIAQGVNPNKFDVFLRAFKKEQKLEIWAKSKDANKYKLIKTYDFCATSGVLGPKRRSGDRQIPEGFYTVDFFNPYSNYHLSFRVNYPNASDKILSDQLNPGDNIFVHGHCVTIGCIPVGDDAINEIYLFAIRAKGSGQTIPVHIFPSKMDDAGYNSLKTEFASNSNLLDFWAGLKPGYDAFEANNALPNVGVDATGKYIIK